MPRSPTYSEDRHPGRFTLEQLEDRVLLSGDGVPAVGGLSGDVVDSAAALQDRAHEGTELAPVDLVYRPEVLLNQIFDSMPVGELRAGNTHIEGAPGETLVLSDLHVSGNLDVHADKILVTGQVIAEGGAISLISSSDLVLASGASVTDAGGTVLLQSISGETILEAGSSINASSDAEKGGEITILGEHVGLFGANLDASGGAGGGRVNLGGDFQGGNNLPTALKLFVSADSKLSADALSAGNGGQVVLWSQEWTSFYGLISVEGGPQEGDAGKVEVSSAGVLVYHGSVALGAIAGKAGSLLLDPSSITLSTSPTDATGVHVSGGDYSEVFADDAGLPVTFDISSAFAGIPGGATLLLEATGDITVATDFDLFSATGNNDVSLILRAGGDITVGGTITSTGTGTIQLEAGADTTTDLVGGGSAFGSGSILVNSSLFGAAGVSLLSHGNAASIILGSSQTVDSSNGDVSIAADGDVTSNASSAITTAGGTLSIRADADADASGTVSLSGDVLSHGGAISVTGTGITQHTGTVSANASTVDGTVSLDGLGGDLNLSGAVPSQLDVISGADLTITTSGDVLLGNIGISGGLSVTTSQGAILQASGTGLDVAGSGSFTTKADAGQAITLDSSGNMIDGTIDAHAFDFTTGTAIAPGAIQITNSSPAGFNTGQIETLDTVILVAAEFLYTSGHIAGSSIEIDAGGDIGATVAPLQLQSPSISLGTIIGAIHAESNSSSTVTVTALTTSGSADVNFAQTGGGQLNIGNVTTDSGKITISNAGGIEVQTAVTTAGNIDVSTSADGLTFNGGSLQGATVTLDIFGPLVGSGSATDITGTDIDITAGSTTDLLTISSPLVSVDASDAVDIVNTLSAAAGPAVVALLQTTSGSISFYQTGGADIEFQTVICTAGDIALGGENDVTTDTGLTTTAHIHLEAANLTLGGVLTSDSVSLLVDNGIGTALGPVELAVHDIANVETFSDGGIYLHNTIATDALLELVATGGVGDISISQTGGGAMEITGGVFADQGDVTITLADASLTLEGGLEGGFDGGNEDLLGNIDVTVTNGDIVVNGGAVTGQGDVAFTASSGSLTIATTAYFELGVNNGNSDGVGNLEFHATDGDLSVDGTLYVDNGNLSLQVNTGNLILGPDTDIEVGYNGGNLDADGDLTLSVVGGNITLSGSIVVDDGNIFATATKVLGVGGGITADLDADLAAKDGDDGLESLPEDPAVDGNVSFTSAADLINDGLLHAANAFAVVSGGSATGIGSIEALSLSLDVATGVGTIAAPLQIDAATLDTTSATGSVRLVDGAGGLAVNSASISSAGDLALETISGNLTVASATVPTGATIDLRSTTSGTIRLGELKAPDGTVTITSASSIEEFGADAADDITTGDLTLIASSGIGVSGALETSATVIQISGGTTANANNNVVQVQNTSSSDVTLSQLTGDKGSIVWSEKGGGRLTVTSASTVIGGHISINSTAGNMDVVSINVPGTYAINLLTLISGNLRIGNAASALGAIAVVSAGMLDELDSDPDVDISAATKLILTAKNGIGANSPPEFTAATLQSPVNLGNVTLNAVSAGLVTISDLSTNNGGISYSQSGGGSLNVLSSKATTDISITVLGSATQLNVDNMKTTGVASQISLSADGKIEESNADPSADITAHAITLSAGTGIGTLATIEISTAQLNASTTSGDLNLANTSINASTAALAATDGSIALTQSGGGNLTVTSASAGVGITLGTTTSGSISVGDVQASSGTITITSARNIEEWGNDAAADLMASSINLQAASGIGVFGILETSATTLTVDGGSTSNGNSKIIQIENGSTSAVTLDKLIATKGSIVFNEKGGGALTVTDAHVSVAGHISISSTGGDMDVTSVVVQGAYAVNLITFASGNIRVGNATAGGVGILSAGAIDELGSDAGVDISASAAIILVAKHGCGTASPLEISAPTLRGRGNVGNFILNVISSAAVTISDLTVNAAITYNQEGGGALTILSCLASGDVSASVVDAEITVDNLASTGAASQISLTSGSTIEEYGIDSAADITAHSIVLSAQTGIGTLGPLELLSQDLTATSASGPVNYTRL